MSEQNKTIIRRLVEDHWNKRNADRAGEFFTENCTIQTPDGMLRGVEGAKQLLNAYATAFPDMHVAIDEIVAEGDNVALRWGFTGAHRGQLGPYPASGKTVSTSGIGIYHLLGGKIVDAHMEWDRVALQQQIGVVQPTAAPTAR